MVMRPPFIHSEMYCMAYIRHQMKKEKRDITKLKFAISFKPCYNFCSNHITFCEGADVIFVGLSIQVVLRRSDLSRNTIRMTSHLNSFNVFSFLALHTTIDSICVANLNPTMAIHCSVQGVPSHHLLLSAIIFFHI